MKKILFKDKINNEMSGKTIKDFLKNKLLLSNRIISNLKNNKGILVNGTIKTVNYRLNFGDVLELYICDHSSENIIPQEMDLDIIFEDDWLLVINKPFGMVVHPTAYHFTDTLGNGVMYYLNQKEQNCKFRPVNRIDKDTSGLVIIAKSQLSHSILSSQIIDNTCKKQYIAVVHNNFTQLSGTINYKIARKPQSIIERYVDDSGQTAITNYTVLGQNDTSSVVKVDLLTGRTHQIRVHFSCIGHPLYGDFLYGSKNDIISRQALHCGKIVCNHPNYKTKLEFVCHIPNDMKELIKTIGIDTNMDKLL